MVLKEVRMSIEQTRAQVLSSVWQGIAQSGVDLSAIAPEQQQKMAGKIADSVLLAVDTMLQEAVQTPVEEGEKEQELIDDGIDQVLWKGRPFLSLVESYTITEERLKIVRGFLSRDVENYELIRVQDIDIKQGVTERMLNIGDITVRGADLSDEAVVLRNIHAPEEVYELMRRAWMESRKRHGLQFREFM
jgi:hypothetical protein